MQLVLKSVTIERGGRTLVSGLDLAVAAGEALLLTGPNGAGKTSLLRTIAGFLAPAEGTFHLDGGAGGRDIAEACHFIGHLNAVKPALTVAENLAFWARFLGGDKKRVEAALSHFGLLDLAHIPAAYLSAGQRRRVCLARLLVAERPLWLLDEPTVSLDARSVRTLEEALSSHVGAGGIALVATHLAIGLEKSRELELGRRAATA